MFGSPLYPSLQRHFVDLKGSDSTTEHNAFVPQGLESQGLRHFAFKHAVSTGQFESDEQPMLKYRLQSS